MQKTTLIDFPGRVACTVFTVGCNYRCPFCHNKDLVSLKNFKEAKLKAISEEDFFKFLEKRKKILDGVCITGGAPTIWPDLGDFCKKIKDLGFEVKLDTNGSNFKMLKKLIEEKLVDFVAMDIKTVFEDYSKAIGVKLPAPIESIKLILESGLEYEFRTTVVPGIHDRKNLVVLAKQLKKIKTDFRWVLQQFRPMNCLDLAYLKVKPYNFKEMEAILTDVRKILPKIILLTY
ncbi:MAG: anaerobic ribonucleoside-triphosphate reductase activating protein [Candidatus Beckwithbacteria bacterium]|nr:anaerobic ribonucleoside-triphosphate reductase activating protein [Patescibacteria group bacterium]